MTGRGIQVIFFFGEKIRIRSIEEGRFACVVCKKQQLYTRFEETNYFTVFSLAIAPLSKIADYCQCSVCGSSYIPDQYDFPACVDPVRRVLVYIMMGYGLQQFPDSVIELHQTLTHLSMSQQDVRTQMTEISAASEDIFEYVERHAFHLNIQGKRKIIEAAFLMTYVACEIEFEDRLRVNLIASALGVSPEFTQFVINAVRAESYYGIKRRLAVAGAL